MQNLNIRSQRNAAKRQTLEPKNILKNKEENERSKLRGCYYTVFQLPNRTFQNLIYQGPAHYKKRHNLNLEKIGVTMGFYSVNSDCSRLKKTYSPFHNPQLGCSDPAPAFAPESPSLYHLGSSGGGQEVCQVNLKRRNRFDFDQRQKNLNNENLLKQPVIII